MNFSPVLLTDFYKISHREQYPPGTSSVYSTWTARESNVKGMMEELKRQHFHGAFCVEYEYHWTNSMPEIAQGLKYFEKTAAELAK